MRTFPATGISLTVKKYRGTQRLVVFFTRERGKVEAVAQGIGKPGSRLASVVEPLVLSRLFFARGRQLDRLTEGEVLNSFYSLRADLQRFAYASYMAELTARATEPGLAIPELFDALRASLESLDSGARPEIVAWGFALRLMQQLGVAPVADKCANCGSALGVEVFYSPTVGGLICADCRHSGGSMLRLSATTAALLRSLLSFPIDRLPRLSCPPDSRAQLGELLRRHIAYHLGFTPVSERFLREIEASGTRHVNEGESAGDQR